MNDLISPLAEIKSELKSMQSVLEETMSEDAQEAVYRGNELAVQMARSGKLLADAKYHRDEKLNSGIVREMKNLISLPATTANKYVDALCKEENYVVNWADRINRAATHKLDWCRTIISKAKAEMSAFGNQNQ